MIISNNRDITKQSEVTYTPENTTNTAKEVEKAPTPNRVVEVSLSAEQQRKAVLSDEELQCAIENVLSAQSSVYDVAQAEEMIAQANRRILEQSDEAVLAQANQTPPMVSELTQ